MDILEPEFTQICKGLAGAEGPIFSKDGQFNMVAPFATNQDTKGGEVLSVDPSNGQVCAINHWTGAVLS